jgi:hypothetical protein
VELDLLDVDVSDEVIHVKVFDPFRIEAGGTADESMDLVALVEEEFGEVRAVLASDAGDECAFFHS